MIDEAILFKAMLAAGYADIGRFGAEVLNANESNTRRWHSGERELPSTARLVCIAIIERPALAGELSALIRTGRVKATKRPTDGGR